jgi:hypothetical protein
MIKIKKQRKDYKEILLMGDSHFGHGKDFLQIQRIIIIGYRNRLMASIPIACSFILEMSVCHVVLKGFRNS